MVQSSAVHQLSAPTNTALLEQLPPLAAFGDAVRYSFGGEQRILVNDPSAIHRFGSTLHKRDSASQDAQRRVMGNGLLVTNDLHFWKPRRLLIQRQLGPARVQIDEPAIMARTTGMIRRWIDQGTVSVRDEIGTLALDNLGQGVFGADFSEFRTVVSTTLELLVEAFDNGESGRDDPELNERLDHHIGLLESIVHRLVGQRQSSAEIHSHVLDALIRAAGTGNTEFADPFVRDEAMTLMMAGHDTTAFLICMAVFQLSQHPEQRATLAAEVSVARRSDLGTESFVKAVPYAKVVAAETLRLFPPLPFMNRTAEVGLEIDGCHVHPGDTVTLSAWVTHRDERFFPEPLRFDPDRFSDDRRAGIPRSTYFPFGMGQRVCAGNHFALLETAIILSLIAADTELEFEVDEPGFDAPSTLRFTDPLIAQVSPSR